MPVYLCAFVLLLIELSLILKTNEFCKTCFLQQIVLCEELKILLFCITDTFAYIRFRFIPSNRWAGRLLKMKIILPAQTTVITHHATEARGNRVSVLLLNDWRPHRLRETKRKDTPLVSVKEMEGAQHLISIPITVRAQRNRILGFSDALKRNFSFIDDNDNFTSVQMNKINFSSAIFLLHYPTFIF